MKKYIIPVSVILLTIVLIVGVKYQRPSSIQNSNIKYESTGIKAIATEELKGNLGKSDWVILDARQSDAYNGWKLDGAARGGHIKNAVDFPSSWLKVDDKELEKKLESILKAKGITKEKNIVVYDANGTDAVLVAGHLYSLGYKKIFTYDVKEWAADSSLAMESYPNYQMLVPAQWINGLIMGEKPETYTGSSYKIFEVSWGQEAKEYKEGHIPSAVHIDTDESEEPPIWNRISDARLQKFAENNGITTDTTVVLYGTDSMAAFRIAAILKYMGVKDVRVLNGGLAVWKNAGYSLETTINQKQPVASFGATVPANKGYIVDMPQAKELLADKEGSRLVDIRSWEEHIGNTPGYSDITAKGRPAGSVWGHAGSDSGHLEDFRNIDNTMKNADEILSMWKEWGITPDKKLAFFCGTGWRAAEVLIYADVMGFPHISLYDGGWYEWSSIKTNPVETGAPKR